MEFDLTRLVRTNIRSLKPYSSARDEFSGEASIYLDANENSLGSPLLHWYNRYPDPLQKKLKEKISSIKNVASEKIFLGNGSDECIDILIRCFCEPGIDNIVICPPTYGMYKVSADINNVAAKEVTLLSNFQLDLEALESNIDAGTKIVFICSPNNPTGNAIRPDDLELILNNFDGLVVIDEAYINFSRFRSWTTELENYPNLVVLQTLSKAWGLAALRLGIAFASLDIVNIMNKVKPPYNINQATQDLGLQALDHVDDVNLMIQELVKEREFVSSELSRLPVVRKVYPSEANFLLVQVINANHLYNYLMRLGIIVRNRSNVILCEDCLRITIGTETENRQLLDALAKAGETGIGE